MRDQRVFIGTVAIYKEEMFQGASDSQSVRR